MKRLFIQVQDWIEEGVVKKLVVITHNSTIVASAILYYFKEEPEVSYITDLYVTDKYRKTGMFTRLMQNLEGEAKTGNKSTYLRLFCNPGALVHLLYQKRGYKFYAYREDKKPDVWLQKKL